MNNRHVEEPKTLKDILDVLEKGGAFISENGLDHDYLKNIPSDEQETAVAELSAKAEKILDLTLGKYNSPEIRKKIEEQKEEFLQGRPIKIGDYEVSTLIALKNKGVHINEDGVLDHPYLHSLSIDSTKTLIDLNIYTPEILNSTIRNNQQHPAINKVKEQKKSFLEYGNPIKLGPREVKDLNMVRQRARETKTIRIVLEKEYA